MTSAPTLRRRTLVLAATFLVLGTENALAQDAVAAEFQGDWVPATSTCESPARFRVAADRMTLINGADSTVYGDIAIAHSFLGPDYDGITVVAIPEINSENYPFTVYFNADEQPGVTRLDLYQEMEGPMNAQVAAIQAAAKGLAERYPLNAVPLKRCPTP